MNKIKREELLCCATEVLSILGENKPGAEITAESLVFADERGISTHGTYLLTPIANRAKEGQLDLPTRITTVQENSAVAVLDGGNGLGAVAGKMAVDLCIKKAKSYGISLVLIRNTNNLGALAFYTEKIAREGMIAIMGCNAAPAMAPWGGAEAFLGTNPFAIAIYTGKELLFSADMATSIVARGKIRKAARDGKAIPDSWALDSEGNLTTSPLEALKGALLPMGGPKGSAIALAIDILSGLISGSSHAPNIKSFHTLDGDTGVGAFFIAIDIQKFMPLNEFAVSMDEYIQKIKGMKKAGFASEIFIPGEIEYRKELQSRENNIALDEKTCEVINSILAENGAAEKLSAMA